MIENLLPVSTLAMLLLPLLTAALAALLAPAAPLPPPEAQPRTGRFPGNRDLYHMRVGR